MFCSEVVKVFYVCSCLLHVDTVSAAVSKQHLINIILILKSEKYTKLMRIERYDVRCFQIAARCVI